MLLGASGSLWEALGAFGSFWEPLGAPSKVWNVDFGSLLKMASGYYSFSMKRTIFLPGWVGAQRAPPGRQMNKEKTMWVLFSDKKML